MNDKTANELNFEPLNETHFALIYNWFNKPHVQTFYSLRPWTMEEVRQKLTPYIQGKGQMKSYVIHLHNQPVGYIQSYPIKEHPWENQDLPDDVIRGAAGLDLFIGEEKLLGKGLGSDIINAFLEKHIWPFYRYCLADPDLRNEISIRLFLKSGFKRHKQIPHKDALKRDTTLQLLIKEQAHPP